MVKIVVSALDDTNRFLQIQFSQKVNSLEPSNITIENAKSKERYGVKEVNLASNGLSAQIELFAADSGYKVLEDLTDYKVTVNANGKTLEYIFNRPAFLDQRVINIDASDREITVNNAGNGKVLKVPSELKDFDFQAVLGEQVRIWHNKDNEVVDFAIPSNTTVYDAIEFTSDNEIKLLSDGSKHKFSKETFNDADKTEKIALFYNGEEAKDGEFVKDKKYNFAKVGLDKSGNVEFIGAYNLTDFLIVDEVDGNEVVGYAGEGTGASFNAKDATIIKDGKIISRSDLEQGDVLFFSKDANAKDGYAEVLNQTVSGKIDTVFSNAVRIGGKDYKFTDRDDLEKFKVNYAEYPAAVYLNDDNETEYIDADAAEELQAAGEVTVYTDRAGNVVYIAGETANVERNTVTSILTSNIVGYSQARDRIEVEAKFSTGEEKLFDMNVKDLKSIIIDGVTYDIDNDNTSSTDKKYVAKLDDKDTLAIFHNVDKDGKAENPVTKVKLNDTKESIVKLHLNKDHNRIEKLEFFDKHSTALGSKLKAKDLYASGKRLTSKTIVFDAKKFSNDPKDITITTWGEYKGTDIKDATVVFDKNNEVIALVINETESDADVYEEAVITNVLKNTDGDVVEVTAFISGEKKTLAVDEVTVSSDFVRGSVAILVFDDNNNTLVQDIIESSDFAKDTDKLGVNYAFKANIASDAVNVGKREVTIGGKNYRLASDGLVIDAKNKSDIKTKALADLRGVDNVTVVLDEKDSTFVKFFVIGAAGDFDPFTATKITSVTALDPIEVAYGTTLATAGLPEKVEVTYDNGEKADVDVTWDGGDPVYDENKPATYTFAGTIDNVLNKDSLKASVKITVLANTDATVTSTNGTVDNDANTIVGITNGTTLADFKTALTPAAGAKFEVYKADGTTVADDLQTGYKVIVTAQDGTTTKTYTVTVL